jgi:hypothetical protein
MSRRGFPMQKSEYGDILVAKFKIRPVSGPATERIETPNWIESDLLSNMAIKDIPPKTHEDSDSDSDEEEIVPVFPKIEIDPSKLTPLSPEVISKQVSLLTTP